jgi:hypothetical protein
MREQELSTPAARVAARAAAARRGESRRGPARAREAAARTQGRHVARGKAAWGRWVRGTWPAKRRRCVGQRNRGGVEVDEVGSVCTFPKVQGLHCKA